MSTDMYLHLENIEGESEDAKLSEHKVMEITGWSTSYEQPVSMAKTGTGPTIERLKAEPITVSKAIDSGTNDLLTAIWGGRVIKNGWISCWRADADKGKPVEYLRINMDHIVVTTYSISGAEGDIAQEEIGLSVGRVEFIYVLQQKIGGDKGQKTADFNFIKGTYLGKNA